VAGSANGGASNHSGCLCKDGGVRYALLPSVASGPTGNADGLAALSTAFVYGSILLAILVVIAGFAWAKFVAHEAKEMAKADAETYIVKWMVEKAPGIIQSHVELLNDATIGEGNDASAADELGKEAG
jgi:hypothetical protein